MADSTVDQAKSFIADYSALFSSPACSSPHGCAGIADQVGKRYRPGVTFFTNGTISRFETQAESARLIELEMRSHIDSGMGTHLELLAIEKVEVYSPTLALCWLHRVFHPKPGSEFAGKDWKFTNIYGYRAADDNAEAGWEFVIRDEEINGFSKATGKTFLG
ncbi:hypothetical protein LTR53_013357 [Teratosphaeriaceae sp. CCFEE 6253]|nr:hypothetical protein LTR53_013357 [Teratosphaeriaceae sp. CCFEE 6253]